MKHYYVLAFLAVLLFSLFGCASIFRQLPKFGDCPEGNFGQRFVCPLDERYITKKNIILVDVTDKLPNGKKQDLRDLIIDFSLPKQSFWDGVLHNWKMEKTSIYMLTDQETASMEPIATFCSPPPNFALQFLPARQRSLFGSAMKKNIEQIIEKIASNDAASHSHIVNALATITSNASYWKPGSRLVLFSDLYENSDTCAYFEHGSIPTYDSVPFECKARVSVLGRNLADHNATGANRKKSTVAICQLYSKEQKEGLTKFWQDLFSSAIGGHEVLFTCDPHRIHEDII